MKTKLELSDSMQDILLKLSEGNPGAMTVCVRLLTEGKQIDPDAAMGGLAALFDLDSLGVYGCKIWMLYNDVCQRDLSKTVAVLRAWQLGFLNHAEVHHAVDNHGEGIDLAAICAQVSERLPRFQLTTESFSA